MNRHILRKLPFYGFKIKVIMLREENDFAEHNKWQIYNNFDFYNELMPRVRSYWKTDHNRLHYMIVQLFMSEEPSIMFEDVYHRGIKIKLTLFCGRGAKLPSSVKDYRLLMDYLDELAEENLFYVNKRQPRISTLGEI